MKTLLLILSLLLFSTSSHARLLVYEYGLLGDGDNHGVYVSQIACRELVYECETFYSEHLNQEDLLTVEASLNPGDVVNMSFVFQKPDSPRRGPFSRRPVEGSEHIDPFTEYRENLERFNNEVSEFERVFAENTQSLFVAAAGNGYRMTTIQGVAWSTLAVPVGSNYLMYPSVMTANNLITVTAIDSSLVDVSGRTDYRITEYSNFSVDTVDVAAPVELDDNGELHDGSSFAAPYVSRVSKRVIETYELSAVDVKSIIMKSVFIENIDRSIELTEDYINNKESSVFNTIHTLRNRKERDELIAENADVMLVKSGGVLVRELALECAKNYSESKEEVTVKEACLKAHEVVLNADEQRLSKLQEFWNLREI